MSRHVLVRSLLGFVGVLGVLIAATPQWLFPVCEFHGYFGTGAAGQQVFMACHRTAVEAVWVGAFLAAVGVMGALWDGTSGLRFASVAAFVGGVVTVALPFAIAPVCASQNMPCASGTLPALTLMGALAMIVAAGAFVLVPRSAVCEDEDAETETEPDSDGGDDSE